MAVLVEAKDRFSGFYLEIEEQARDRLSDDVAGLKMRLTDLPTESLEVLNRQLAEKQTLRVQREAAAKRLSELFITWLRARPPAESIARIGALFDRRVLESVIDEQVRVINEAELIHRLKVAAERCDPRGDEDDAIALEFPAGAVSAAVQIGRIDRLQEEIRALAREVERLARNIETVNNAAPFRERLPVAQKELVAQIERIAGYQCFREDEAKAEDYMAALKLQADAIKQLEKRMAKNLSARSAVEREQAIIRAKFEKVEKEDIAIRRESGKRPTATGQNPGKTPVSEQMLRDLPESLLEVFSNCPETL